LAVVALTAGAILVVRDRGGGEPQVVVDLGPGLPEIDLHGGSYVALGDSYAAGEGVQPYEEAAGDLPLGDNCHRSMRAYPLVLNFVEPQNRDFFFACASAWIGNVLDEPQITDRATRRRNRFGVQGEGRLDDDTVLVTLMVGGNDAEFTDVFKFCAAPRRRSCLDDPYVDDDRDDGPYDADDDGTLLDWADSRLAQIEEQLTDLFGDLRARAGHARILVLGYPHLFPPASVKPRSLVCRAAYFVAFQGGERSGLRTLTDDLNAAIDRAASASGVEFVPTSTIFAGHEPCGRHGQWVNFIKRQGFACSRECFHPNQDGHSAFALAVACHLATNADPSADPQSGSAATAELTACVREEQADL
jgi:lysophospholipase L1-like esterase